MKICPKCQKVYTDENLNFCLEDGAVLSQKNDARDSHPETVLINQPRGTNPNQPYGAPPVQPGNFGNAPTHSMPPKKSSKTWLWGVGVLGLVILVCGGGFVGMMAWVATLDTNTNSVANANVSSNRKNSVGSSPAASPKKSISDERTDDRTDVQPIELAAWVKAPSSFGTTEYENGEFVMGSIQKGFYYVLVAPEQYKTESANTRVSVRNIADASTNLGFGLIVHSNPSPLIKDYAFLIDSVKKRFRVVRHTPQKEMTVTNWTDFAAIKGGTDKNILEVRDKGGVMDFYINGELADSVKNTDGYKGGVAGIYSGDAVKAAFSDFEIRQ